MGGDKLQEKTAFQYSVRGCNYPPMILFFYIFLKGVITSTLLSLPRFLLQTLVNLSIYKQLINVFTSSLSGVFLVLTRQATSRTSVHIHLLSIIYAVIKQYHSKDSNCLHHLVVEGIRSVYH